MCSYRKLSQNIIDYHVVLGTDGVSNWVKTFTQLFNENFACCLRRGCMVEELEKRIVIVMMRFFVVSQ